MKKISLILIATASILLTSCRDYSIIDDSIVVEQINILEGQSHKYQVKLKSRVNEKDVYYYTNYRHQVGDTMVVLTEFFGKKDAENKILKVRIESLSKALDKANYYLELLNEKVIFSFNASFGIWFKCLRK